MGWKPVKLCNYLSPFTLSYQSLKLVLIRSSVKSVVAEHVQVKGRTPGKFVMDSTDFSTTGNENSIYSDKAKGGDSFADDGDDGMKSWHIDGYSFFVLGMDGGQWTQASRARYNLKDTVALSTVQVYPKSWTAISMALDNVGMWNVRSQNWARQYLGQQFYLRVYSPAHSWRDQLPIPRNAILYGRAKGRHTRPL
ncbi:hypothetical protein ACLB2K_038893 [Fragaria x ananassa]